MDLVIYTNNEIYATDVSVVYPGRVKQTNNGALQDQFRMKELKWVTRAQENNIKFVPFILDTTGGIHKRSMHWLIKVAGTIPYPYNAKTAISEALIKVTIALHEGNAIIYNNILRR